MNGFADALRDVSARDRHPRRETVATDDVTDEARKAQLLDELDESDGWGRAS
ncbi:hypothetical protein [Caballeronia sp. LZ001]|uniref:hypothetical protein n=1 Tax=Caballeronia sp. LZ001 TaxID=3038553 RepID=UPI00286581BA|nr:hypothetical protein [Caballeronia sp. LZ001]MDR5806487.1 hypothetical protein [Caballeronia sp. LZ001]